MVNDCFQAGSIIPDFFTPVAQDRGWAYHQKRFFYPAVFAQIEHEGHDFVGFAKAHIITEQTTETVFIQKRNPLGAQPLIGSQF